MRTKLTTLFGEPLPKGNILVMRDGKVVRPVRRPIIPFIWGDGIGQEISPVVQKIIDAAVNIAYGGKRRIVWLKTYAGDEALSLFGDTLPEDTIKAIEKYHVAIKGPLGTPPNDMRSLNVYLRLLFLLYQCIRPIHYLEGVPSPVVRPADLDIVIFRENIEGPYTGTEFPPGSQAAEEFIALARKWEKEIPAGSGIGLSFASEAGSKNLVRKAIQYAIDHGRKVVTIVAKSNNLKYTDGAFLAWGRELADCEFADLIVHEDDFWNVHHGVLPDGKILLNSKITDDMFQQILLNPKKYSVVATTNLNGDYLSDSAAAIHGGLGQASGVNKGDRHAIYEPTHGTAPDIAGQNKANPTSQLLSGVMMLEDILFAEAGALINTALAKTIAAKTVTADFARFITGATTLSTTEFGDAIIANLRK